MRTHVRLETAREALRDRGGWLLRIGGGVYLVTEDVRLVRDLRGDDYVERCDSPGGRDETLAPPAVTAGAGS